MVYERITMAYISIEINLIWKLPKRITMAYISIEINLLWKLPIL